MIDDNICQRNGLYSVLASVTKSLRFVGWISTVSICCGFITCFLVLANLLWHIRIIDYLSYVFHLECLLQRS